MHQKEERSVIRFLSSEGVKPIEIHRQMKVQYADACLSLQQVYESTRKFMTVCLFGLWVRIPPVARMSASCVCCVLLGIGFWDG
jgi:hypothetical protein